MLLAQTLHLFAVLALAAHGLTLLASRTPRRDLQRWLVAGLVCCLCLAPLAWASRAQAAQVSWLTRPTWTAVGRLAGDLLGPSLPAALLVGALVTVGVTVRRPGHHGPWLATVALPLGILPPALLLLVSQIHPLYVDRYVLFSATAVPMLAGAGLDALAARAAGIVGHGRVTAYLGSVLAVVLLASLLVATLPALRAERSPDSRHDDLAAAADIVGRHHRTGDAVLFLTPIYRGARLAYPARFRGMRDVSLAGDPAATATLYGTARSPAGTDAAMLTAPRLWVLGRPGLRVRRGYATVFIRDFLRDHFTLARTYPVHGVGVALYVRRSDHDRDDRRAGR